MDTEIRAMFPAAMDVQRRRFFQALSRIAGASDSEEDREELVPLPAEPRARAQEIRRPRTAPNRLIHYDLDPKASQEP